MTYTYALMEVSESTYREIKQKLLDVGYAQALHNEEGKNGYPNIYLPEIGATGNAHRIVWFLLNGFISKGHLIMHKCDNRICINPKHLILGTNAINLKDMRDKGRGYILPIGEKSHVSKVTNAQVKKARRMAKNGESYSVIARQLKIHPSHVSRIARGLTRSCAGGSLIKRLRRTSVTKEQAKEIIKMRKAGMIWQDIADQMNLSRSAVMRVTTRHMAHKHPGYRKEKVVVEA